MDWLKQQIKNTIRLEYAVFNGKIGHDLISILNTLARLCLQLIFV